MMTKNAFFLREWWVWKRESRGLGGTRLLYLAAVVGPLLVSVVLEYLNGGPGEYFTACWILAAILWLAALTLCSISATTGIFQRERDLGTLQVSGITATRPEREVLGRWAASLMSVGEGWLMGAILVALALVPSVTTYPIFNVVAAWLFVLIWCGFLGAVGLACASQARTAAGAFTGTILMILGGTYATCLFVAQVIQSYRGMSNLPMDNAYVLMDNALWCLPPIPTAAFCIMSSPSPLALLALTAPLWLFATYAALRWAAHNVRHGAPLRVASASAAAGPKGLIPTPAHGAVVRYDTPWHQQTACTADDFARLRGSLPAAGGRRSPVDLILTACRDNPFYHAYRRGFMRAFATVAAAPGSVLPPAFVILGLLIYTIGFHYEPEIMANGLVVWLSLGVIVSALEAFNLSSRALSAERDQATWPLLVVTGMRPARILSGKFATTFYALSGEWLWTTPFWLLALLVTRQPGLALLYVAQPAAVALAAVLGLWGASQPRYLVIHLRKAAMGAVAVVAALWFTSTLSSWFWLKLFDLIPFGVAWRLAAARTIDLQAAALVHGLLLAGGAALLAAWVWRSASKRLSRVMAGE